MTPTLKISQEELQAACLSLAIISGAMYPGVPQQLYLFYFKRFRVYLHFILDTQTEIDDFDTLHPSLADKHDVLRLDVSMDHLHGFKVIKSLQDLIDNIFNVFFFEFLVVVLT
jgi:hypothetical protein